MTRMPRYLGYQLGDYLLQRASLPLILVLFVGGLPLYALLHNDRSLLAGPQGPAMVRQLFASTVALFLPLGAFLAASGIVSTDRHQGHVRFYFARPVNVVGFYVQTYVVHGVCFTLLFGLITWVFGLLALPQSIAGAMGAAALTFVLIGGLGLLLSTLTRFDGALLVLLYLVSFTMQQIAAIPGRPQLPAWAMFLARILPPAHPLDQLRDHLFAGSPLDMAQLWHVLAYGAAAFILGLVALRRLPLAR